MAIFDYKGQMNGAENPVDLHVLIGNSGTVAVGEAVKMDSFSNGGGVLRATAGSKVLGVVVGIVTNKGIPLANASTSDYDGTFTESSNTYAATSDNTTDKKVKAIVRIDEHALWRNDTAGDLAVADLLKYFDLSSATQVGDQNGHDTAGALQLMEIDPDDASVGVFRIAEGYHYPYAQQ
jgi:hypothetical protein